MKLVAQLIMFASDYPARAIVSRSSSISVWTAHSTPSCPLYYRNVLIMKDHLIHLLEHLLLIPRMARVL